MNEIQDLHGKCYSQTAQEKLAKVVQTSAAPACEPPSPLLRPFSPLDKVLLLPPSLSCILQAERHGLLLVTYQAGDDDYELDLMQSRFTFSIF